VQKEKAGPLVLATLSDHTSTVNAVRFSKNGRFLASGAVRRERCRARRRSLGSGGQRAGGGARRGAAYRNSHRRRFKISRLSCCCTPLPTTLLLPPAPQGRMTA
jgi:hypothetical protein